MDAAEVIAEFMCGATRVRPVGASLQLADALAAAGLLCTPQERAVIDAAKRLNVFVGAGVNDRTVRNVIADLCVAVEAVS